MGAGVSSAAKGVAKATAKTIPKVIRGSARGTGKVIKGIKRGGERAIKGVKGFFGGGKMKPAVIREQVIQKGSRPVKQMKILGKFDETIPTGLPAIRDIPKTGFVKQTLSKAQRLKNAKQAIRNI